MSLTAVSSQSQNHHQWPVLDAFFQPTAWLLGHCRSYVEVD